MKLFNGRPTESLEVRVAKLFKKSRPNFKYAQKRIKEELLATIEEQQLTRATKLVQELKQASFLKRHKYVTALGVAILIATGSGAALSQAGVYEPTQAINVLGQVQEGVMIRLPLPAEQKANWHMRVVESRSRKLEQALDQPEEYQKTSKALEKSNEIMLRAVNQITENRQRQLENGQNDDEQKYSAMLERLASMAADQEQAIQEMVDSKTPTNRSEEIQNHLETVKNIRIKAEAGLGKKPRQK